MISKWDNQSISYCAKMLDGLTKLEGFTEVKMIFMREYQIVIYEQGIFKMGLIFFFMNVIGRFILLILFTGHA